MFMNIAAFHICTEVTAFQEFMYKCMNMGKELSDGGTYCTYVLSITIACMNL